MDEINFSISSENINKRIDIFLSQKFKRFSRSFISKLIEKNKILVKKNNFFLPVKKSYILKLKDNIRICLPEKLESDILAENLPIKIVYEDEYLLVINKSKGMVVHPGANNYTGTLVNALLFHRKGQLSGINGKIRPGIVHRLDKDTSGLLIVAKNDFAHKILSEQISSHLVHRVYEAIVIGNLKNNFGVINAPIGRSLHDRKKMAVTNKNSKYAITYYEVLKCFKNFTHVKLILKTGRTHQIRVHMAYIGNPVVGDEVYGPKNKFDFLKGQCLHAKSIEFVHPKFKKKLKFSSELPNYFKIFLEYLKHN